MLRKWYNEYIKNKELHKTQRRRPKYSEEEIQATVKYYSENGKCISRTIKELGYPCRPYLHQWLKERVPDYKIHCHMNKSLVNLTQDKKKQAAIDLCVREGTAENISDKYGVSRVSLYNWKQQLLSEEGIKPMHKHKKIQAQVSDVNISELQHQVDSLTQKAEDLQQQIYRMQLEKEALEKATEIIKKDQGVSLDSLTNYEKAIVIDALREKHLLKELLTTFHMAKSSYCYQENAIKRSDKYAVMREKVRQVFSSSFNSYGYRRIHSSIKSEGITISEKVIRRLMQEESLVVRIHRKRKYSSYTGEISPAVPNLLERDFHADAPNIKWLTDITEFNIPSGRIYLSPIIDCFDGLPVSWTIDTSPNAELVNTMLDNAISTLKPNEHPLVHSDRGCHYRWPGWVERMEKAQLTRSMSKKGCSPDNSACEGFFGRLKNEMFYCRSWAGITIEQFIDILNEYIHWYAEKRIKLSLGGMSPLDYRRSLGLV